MNKHADDRRTSRVLVTDFGARPGARTDATAAVRAALEACRNRPGATLVFPEGRYDFQPDEGAERVYHESNSDDLNPRLCAILIEGADSLTVDGGGSLFVFHGQMQPLTIDRSRGITIRNVRIDWDVPLTAQARVAETGEGTLDLRINDESPYAIEDGQLVFTGEGWRSRWWGTLEFDPVMRQVAPGTADTCFGGSWDYTAVDLGCGLVRLTHRFKRVPAKGQVLILRHNPRRHAGVFLINSRDVVLEGIGLHHTGGLGILAQFCENLTVRDTNVVPNPDKDRYFSGHDDGLHVSNCRGRVNVTNCRFEGLMDDPINVHGTSVRIEAVTGPDRVVCRFVHPQSIGLDWCHAGDRIAFIRHERLDTAGVGTLASFTVADDREFEVCFDGPLPAGLGVGDALENLTWTPDLHVRGCHFGSCRARGLLISTPGRVVVEDCHFESSGSAILIAGDANGWYESGGVRDVTIRNNRFAAACLTSYYQFTEAIIAVYPEIPVLDEDTPPYHRSILIEGNVFHAFDYPVLFARSVGGLTFRGNRIARSYDFAPWHARRATFWLQACREVSIVGNDIAADVLGRNIRCEFMRSGTLTVAADQGLACSPAP